MRIYWFGLCKTRRKSYIRSQNIEFSPFSNGLLYIFMYFFASSPKRAQDLIFWFALGTNKTWLYAVEVPRCRHYRCIYDFYFSENSRFDKRDYNDFNLLKIANNSFWLQSLQLKRQKVYRKAQFCFF